MRDEFIPELPSAGPQEAQHEAPALFEAHGTLPPTTFTFESAVGPNPVVRFECRPVDGGAIRIVEFWAEAGRIKITPLATESPP